MGNSFGSYSEPGTRHNYQAEASPMVRDDDVCTPELRRRRVEEGAPSHISRHSNLQCAKFDTLFRHNVGLYVCGLERYGVKLTLYDYTNYAQYYLNNIIFLTLLLDATAY